MWSEITSLTVSSTANSSGAGWRAISAFLPLTTSSALTSGSLLFLPSSLLPLLPSLPPPPPRLWGGTSDTARDSLLTRGCVHPQRRRPQRCHGPLPLPVVSSIRRLVPFIRGDQDGSGGERPPPLPRPQRSDCQNKCQQRNCHSQSRQCHACMYDERAATKTAGTQMLRRGIAELKTS